MDHIAEKASVAREAMRLEADKQNQRIMTYRNKNRSTKTFKVGDVVLKKQTQVSVGPNSAIRPKFTGPYHIDSIRPNESSADIVHFRTGKSLHCHFTELQKLHYDQQYARLPDSFDNTTIDMLPDKYSRARYLASQPFDTQNLTQTQARSTQHDQDDEPSRHQDDDQVGADDEDRFSFSDFPDDRPAYDLSHIDISNIDRSQPLDLSHINLEDHRITPGSQRSTQSQQRTQSQRSTQSHISPSQIPQTRPPQQDDQEQRANPFIDSDEDQNQNQDDDLEALFNDDHLPSHSQYSTEDADITVIRDPKAHFTITEYKTVDRPMSVHVDNLDPTQRVTELQVDPSVRPIKVTVVTEPADGTVEDTPKAKPPRRQYTRRRRKKPDPPENPYKKEYKTYARDRSTPRYLTRSKAKPHQSNKTITFVFKPP
jgi:hypothetical protein